jgi:hypothetical protein
MYNPLCIFFFLQVSPFSNPPPLVEDRSLLCVPCEYALLVARSTRTYRLSDTFQILMSTFLSVFNYKLHPTKIHDHFSSHRDSG